MLVGPVDAVAYEGALGGGEGFVFAAVQRAPATAQQPVPRLVIVLHPVPSRAKRCCPCDGVSSLTTSGTRRRTLLSIFVVLSGLVRTRSTTEAFGRWTTISLFVVLLRLAA